MSGGYRTNTRISNCSHNPICIDGANRSIHAGVGDRQSRIGRGGYCGCRGRACRQHFNCTQERYGLRQLGRHSKRHPGTSDSSCEAGPVVPDDANAVLLAFNQARGVVSHVCCSRSGQKCVFGSWVNLALQEVGSGNTGWSAASSVVGSKSPLILHLGSTRNRVGIDSTVEGCGSCGDARHSFGFSSWVSRRRSCCKAHDIAKDPLSSLVHDFNPVVISSTWVQSGQVSGDPVAGCRSG